MFVEQQGCCAICGRHQSEFKARLSVDHNHATKKIRKLLCSQCNCLLGCVKDNSEILREAIKYLRETD